MQEALDKIERVLEEVDRCILMEAQEMCIKALEETEDVLGHANSDRFKVVHLVVVVMELAVSMAGSLQVVKTLMIHYSTSCEYKKAYEMIDKMREKLDLSFTIDSRQRIAELEEIKQR